MDFDGLQSIFRTGGNMPARRRSERRNGIFVKIDREQKHPAKHLHQKSGNTLHGMFLKVEQISGKKVTGKFR